MVYSSYPPNILQNTPDLVAVLQNGAQLNVTFRVSSLEVNSTYPIYVDFYISDSNDGEGAWLLQNIYWQTPNSNKLITVNPGQSSGFIAAMATDANGNSSEMGLALPFQVQAQEEIFADSFEQP